MVCPRITHYARLPPQSRLPAEDMLKFKEPYLELAFIMEGSVCKKYTDGSIIKRPPLLSAVTQLSVNLGSLGLGDVFTPRDDMTNY